jgi:hypothetical protein
METNIVGKSSRIIPNMDPKTTQQNNKPKSHRKLNIRNYQAMAANMDLQK